MKQSNRLIYCAALAAALCARHQSARAQAAPAERPTQASAAGDRVAPPNPDSAAKMMNVNLAARTAQMIGRTGGSLMKASLAVQTDPAKAKLVQLGYFAVPEKEPKILKKHDLVQVIIREESAATSKAQNDLQKNVELQAQVAQMFKLKLGSGSLYGLPTPTNPAGLDVTGARTFHGQGEMDRSDTLNARITAEILDVKPNGVLVLQARKRIKTDDEDQLFILTGSCRAEDIGSDNTLLSTQLYDLTIQKNSKGDVRQSTERGYLPKLLDFVNPF
ncbi:MAG TPA: flagellar basal body L-ring protein FlgH [Tepidisphaeraceae bacterium]|nr:flagellar basal body L-ring protein FlgH [Tepidisphaeraceae bacterium]